jgi:uncharacterized membrane protein
MLRCWYGVRDMSLIINPALWASLAGLLAAIGVEIPNMLVEHIIEAIAALCGIVGIVFSWRNR